MSIPRPAPHPEEVGRIWLPLYFGERGNPGGLRRLHANLRICVLGGDVLLKIGDGEEVVLDVEARDEFVRLWMDAERAAEAQAVTS